MTITDERTLTALMSTVGDIPDLDAITGRPAWHAQAACRTEDPDLFFTGRGETTGPAKAICANCPVRDTCLDEHLYEPVGVWGGLSERERRTERIKRNGRRGKGRRQADGNTANILRALVAMGGTWTGTGYDLCRSVGIDNGVERALVTDMRRRGLVDVTYKGRNIGQVTVTAYGLEAVGL